MLTTTFAAIWIFRVARLSPCAANQLPRSGPEDSGILAHGFAQPTPIPICKVRLFLLCALRLYSPDVSVSAHLSSSLSAAPPPRVRAHGSEISAKYEIFCARAASAPRRFTLCRFQAFALPLPRGQAANPLGDMLSSLFGGGVSAGPAPRVLAPRPTAPGLD